MLSDNRGLGLLSSGVKQLQLNESDRVVRVLGFELGQGGGDKGGGDGSGVRGNDGVRMVLRG